jgi:hypothetical protein
MSATALNSTKYRFSGLIRQNIEFFGLVPKSSTHTGFIFVKTLEPNIPGLGPLTHQPYDSCARGHFQLHQTVPEWKEQEAEVMKFKREPSAEELPKGNEDEDTKKAKGRSPEEKSRSTEEESSSGSDGSSRCSSESKKEANKEEKVKKRPSKNRIIDASSEDNSSSEYSRS